MFYRNQSRDHLYCQPSFICQQYTFYFIERPRVVENLGLITMFSTILSTHLPVNSRCLCNSKTAWRLIVCTSSSTSIDTVVWAYIQLATLLSISYPSLGTYLNIGRGIVLKQKTNTKSKRLIFMKCKCAYH